MPGGKTPNQRLQSHQLSATDCNDAPPSVPLSLNDAGHHLLAGKLFWLIGPIISGPSVACGVITLRSDELLQWADMRVTFNCCRGCTPLIALATQQKTPDRCENKHPNRRPLAVADYGKDLQIGKHAL